MANIHKEFEIVRETEKAIRLAVDGVEFWLPKSVIHNMIITETFEGRMAEAFVYDKFWNENYNKAQQTAEPEINPNDLPRDLIKRILKFIHPDKHDNSKEANDLTAEILKYR